MNNSKQLVLRLRTLPNDANYMGDIFGGWLMAQIDIAGGIAASRRAKGAVVTVAVTELQLLKPIYVHDLVSFYAAIKSVGKTSVTVEIEVYAERSPVSVEEIKVSQAVLVYVAVSKPGVKREVPQEV